MKPKNASLTQLVTPLVEGLPFFAVAVGAQEREARGAPEPEYLREMRQDIGPSAPSDAHH